MKSSIMISVTRKIKLNLYKVFNANNLISFCVIMYCHFRAGKIILMVWSKWKVSNALSSKAKLCLEITPGQFQNMHLTGRKTVNKWSMFGILFINLFLLVLIYFSCKSLHIWCLRQKEHNLLVCLFFFSLKIWMYFHYKSIS